MRENGTNDPMQKPRHGPRFLMVVAVVLHITLEWLVKSVPKT